MQSKALCLMVGIALSCTGCQGRTAGQRLNDLEEQVANTDSSLTAMHGRVTQLEQNVDTLRDDVRAQAQRKYEVCTKDGKATKYVVQPLPSVPVPQVKAPDLTPLGTPAAPTAPVIPTGAPAQTSAPAQAPVGGAVVIPPPTHPVNISTISPATTGTAALLVGSQPQPVAAPQTGTPPVARPSAPVLPAASTPAPAPAAPPAVTPAPVVPAPAAQTPASTPAQTSDLALPPDGDLSLPPEGNTAAVPAPAATPASPAYTAAAAPAVPAAPAATRATGNAGYQTALREIMGGQLNQGRTHMQEFVQQNPQSKLAANAHYWIGESYYAQRNYPEALAEFKQVSVQYPQHHKTADALLKAGMTYQRLGDQQNAGLQFKALLADYPNSQAAQIARSKGWGR